MFRLILEICCSPCTLIFILYQPNMLVIDILAMRLSNQLSLLCISKQQLKNPIYSTFMCDSSPSLMFTDLSGINYHI